MIKPIYPRYRHRIAPPRLLGRSFGSKSTLWTPGQTVWVSFLGSPDRDVKMAIFETACQWLDLSDANLTLELSEDNDEKAQIRVLADPSQPHNESYIGTEALDLPDETMSLNVVPGGVEFEKTVLHEFGHALGAEHEHRHPESNIPWDKEAVLHHYVVECGWSHDDVMQQVLTKSENPGMMMTAYDPTSIMHYEVFQELTLGDWQVSRNFVLSEKDLEFMRLAYPH